MAKTKDDAARLRAALERALALVARAADPELEAGAITLHPALPVRALVLQLQADAAAMRSVLEDALTAPAGDDK